MPKSMPTPVGRGDTLATAIDAHRAEQRNAESLLSRLSETRDTLVARSTEETRLRLEALDREIAAVTARVKQALRLQGELMLEWGRSGGEPARG